MDEKRSFGAGALRGLPSVPLAFKRDLEYFNYAPMFSLSILVTSWKIFTKIWLAAVCSVHVPNRVGIGLHRFSTQKASKIPKREVFSCLDNALSWRPTTLRKFANLRSRVQFIILTVLRPFVVLREILISVGKTKKMMTTNFYWFA